MATSTSLRGRELKSGLEKPKQILPRSTSLRGRELKLLDKEPYYGTYCRPPCEVVS